MPDTELEFDDTAPLPLSSIKLLGPGVSEEQALEHHRVRRFVIQF